MWVDMSPMRSSDALMRSALTTMRRSRATGCWRARIVIASSSSATARWSMRSSSAMTSSARLTFDSLNARVAFSIEIGDELGDLDEPLLHLAQFLLEHLTHVVDPSSLWPVPGARRAGHSGPGTSSRRQDERQVPGCLNTR